MSLAHKLDELKLANEQGLLNDDEWRLLRQDLFLRYSNSTLVRPSDPVVEPVPDTHIKSRARHKYSFITLSNIFKRATGPKPSIVRPSTAPPGHKPSLLNKASEFFSPRTDTTKRSVPSPPTSPRPSDTPRHQHIPSLKQTPTIPTFPLNHVHLSPATSIFDDRNLLTSKDIRAAIIATETEAQRLMDAFNDLESRTSFRVHQRDQQDPKLHTRRLPSASVPEQLFNNPLIDQTHRRNHRPPIHSPSPVPLPGLLDRRPPHIYQHVQMATTDPSSNANHNNNTNDSASVRSGSSSIQTNLSRSKSISSLHSRKQQQQQQLHPGSPLSAKFSQYGILRKASVSSISSQAHSARRLMVSPGASSSWSRSTGHLPLSKLVEKDDTHPGDPVGVVTAASPEVTEIQRHKEAVMARYVARIDYLKARLNSVERQEKLSRR